MNRFDLRGADGASLAVWTEGDGPAIVLVHGSVADHTTLTPLIDALVAAGMATYSMDRRGFGASTDGPEYAIEREFEDVAAVIDAVAARVGGAVGLFGHSYGANCAMGGAALTEDVGRLILYEPSLGVTYPPGSIDAIEKEVAAGNLDGAVVRMFVDILGMSQDEIAALKASTTPSWQTRIASAWTLPRECHVEEHWVYEPGQFTGITAPTLMLTGSESPVEMRQVTDRAAAAIGGAEIRLLEGHAHMAHKADPGMVAGLIREVITG